METDGGTEPAIKSCLDLRVLSPASWPPVFESVAGVLGAEGWSGWWGALEILILTRSDSQYGFGPVPPWVPVSLSVEETADQILLCCQAVPCFDGSLYLLDAGDHLSPFS